MSRHTHVAKRRPHTLHTHLHMLSISTKYLAHAERPNDRRVPGSVTHGLGVYIRARIIVYSFAFSVGQLLIKGSHTIASRIHRSPGGEGERRSTIVTYTVH
jgi:hypothetical protein